MGSYSEEKSKTEMMSLTQQKELWNQLKMHMEIAVMQDEISNQQEELNGLHQEERSLQQKQISPDTEQMPPSSRQKPMPEKSNQASASNEMVAIPLALCSSDPYTVELGSENVIPQPITLTQENHATVVTPCEAYHQTCTIRKRKTMDNLVALAPKQKKTYNLSPLVLDRSKIKTNNSLPLIVNAKQQEAIKFQQIVSNSLLQPAIAPNQQKPLIGFPRGIPVNIVHLKAGGATLFPSPSIQPQKQIPVSTAHVTVDATGATVVHTPNVQTLNQTSVNNIPQTNGHTEQTLPLQPLEVAKFTTPDHTFEDIPSIPQPDKNVRFTPEQNEYLRQKFEKQKYFSHEEMVQLGDHLNVDWRKVKRWLHTQRRKFHK